jgi:hypothetical protein
MPAGYSKRPLVEKLGVKPGMTFVVLGAPAGYDKTLDELPHGARLQARLRGPLKFIQFFTKQSKELESRFAALKRALAPDGALWISWPKGTAKVSTDLSDGVVREIGLRHGLVDIKVCAVDETWSGLKFVYRVKDRQ